MKRLSWINHHAISEILPQWPLPSHRLLPLTQELLPQWHAGRFTTWSPQTSPTLWHARSRVPAMTEYSVAWTSWMSITPSPSLYWMLGWGFQWLWWIPWGKYLEEVLLMWSMCHCPCRKEVTWHCSRVIIQMQKLLDFRWGSAPHIQPHTYISFSLPWLLIMSWHLFDHCGVPYRGFACIMSYQVVIGLLSNIAAVTLMK